MSEEKKKEQGAPEEAAQPEVVEEEEVPVQKDAEQPKEDGNDGADVPADGK